MNVVLNQIIFQIINFSIILFVLFKFLYKPILKVLDQRTQKIDQGVKAAEDNIKAQDDMDTTVKTELTKARKEASIITNDSKKAAETDAASILAKAKENASKILEKDRKAMEASLDQEKKRLESDFVLMVTQTTEELLRSYLSKQDQQIIVDKQIKELKNVTLT